MKIRSRKNITKWNLFFNYFSIVIGIINGLIIVPFYLKFIDHGLYGAWLATGSLLVWLTIIEPGVGDVLQQKVSSNFGSKDLKKVGLYISSGIVISSVISVLVFALSLVFQLFLVQILNLSAVIDTEQLLKAFGVAALGTGFMMFSFACVGANQGLQSSLGIGIIYVFVNISAVVINITLLFKGYGLMSIAYANLTRGLGMSFFNLVYLIYRVKRQEIPLGFSIAFFKKFSRLFSYTFLSKISTTIVTHIDLILVARFIGPEMVTMFELSRRPIKVIQGFTNRVSVSFMPSLANLKGEGDSQKLKQLFITFAYFFLWVSFFMIFGFVALNGHLLNIWAGKDIFIGNSLNILICISFLLTSITYNISNFTFALGNIKGNSQINMLKSLEYVVLIVILGYFFGIYGVVIASILAVIASEAWYYPRKISTLLSIHSNDWSILIKESTKLLLIGVLISVFYLWLMPSISSWLLLVLYAIIFAVLYFGLLFLVSAKIRLSLKSGFTLIKSKLFRIQA